MAAHEPPAPNSRSTARWLRPPSRRRCSAWRAARAPPSRCPLTRPRGRPQRDRARELAGPARGDRAPARRRSRSSCARSAVRAAAPRAPSSSRCSSPLHGDTIAFKWKAVPAGRRRRLEQRASQGGRGLRAPALVPRSARLRGSDHRPALPPARDAAVARGGRRAEPPRHAAACSACSPSGSSRSRFPSTSSSRRASRPTPQYAANVGRFNLLTYLVEHEDGRAGNILVSKAPEDRRVFAIDNGIAFDASGQELVRPQLERDPRPRPAPPRDRTAAARSGAARSTGSAW